MVDAEVDKNLLVARPTVRSFKKKAVESSVSQL